MATHSSLRKGQKVRVTYDATYIVSGVPDTQVLAYVELSNGPAVVPTGATMEPIEDLQDDDVVRDDRGWILCRSRAGGWLVFGESAHYADDDALRPLTLLVRDGQPVQP